MSVDTAAAQVKLRDITRTFDQSAEAATPFYPEICQIVNSDGADEKYGWTGSMPYVREWLGERAFQQLRAANYVVENKKWESSLLIAKDDLMDDRINQYDAPMASLAAKATYHPDQLLYNSIIAGESTACFDGQFFFDTDHSWGDSGTQSNDLTYTVTSTSAVTAAEFKAAYHQARKTMLRYVNDQGEPLNDHVDGKLSNLLILVPPELELVAHEAIDSALSGGGNTNVVLDKPRIHPSVYLTSAVKFYLFDLSTAMRPFVFQQREPLTRGFSGLTDLETKDVKFMTQARYNVGYAFWWKAVLTTLST